MKNQKSLNEIICKIESLKASLRSCRTIEQAQFYAGELTVAKRELRTLEAKAEAGQVIALF